MDTIKRISTFKPELLEAFKKMILGINVQITEDCRDERVTIVSQNHYIMSGLKLTDIIL